jgi:hypothetical protein
VIYGEPVPILPGSYILIHKVRNDSLFTAQFAKIVCGLPVRILPNIVITSSGLNGGFELRGPTKIESGMVANLPELKATKNYNIEAHLTQI